MGAGASRNAAQAAVNAVLDSILQAAKEEQTVHISHLGTFAYRNRRQRDGRGLPTQSPLPPRNTRRLIFRPAKRLRELSTAPRKTPAQ